MTRTLITIAAIAFLAVAGYALRITPEQIEACQESTGWAAERCEVVLSR